MGPRRHADGGRACSSLIAFQGYRIAVHAPDTFSGLLAAGITTWLVVQACINMMVVTALLPVTGIPLPFISYGGSALIINLVAVGILLSICRETYADRIHARCGIWCRAAGQAGTCTPRWPSQGHSATREAR